MIWPKHYLALIYLVLTTTLHVIGSDEVITVPTTVVSSSVTSPTSDIPEQTTADEDSNDETTTNVYGNDTNLIGIQDGHDGTNFSSILILIISHLIFSLLRNQICMYEELLLFQMWLTVLMMLTTT